MALKIKYQIDDVALVPFALQEYYVKGESGFTLAVDGHPDGAKVAEFRQTNVRLMRERDELKAKLAAFDGIDPNAPKGDVAKLEADLAAERAAHAQTQLANTISVEFLRAGGRESAVEFMVDRAAKVFAMADGKVTTKEFAAGNPAEPLSIGEWLEQQAKTADFAFKPSKGGGAPPSSQMARLGATSSAKELRNPTAQQLGEHAADIATGKVKIVYTEGASR